MRAVKVALSAAALVASIAATSQPSVRVAPAAPTSAIVEPAAPTQRAAPPWYQDPIAITLGLIALFAVGDIALMIASQNQRAHHGSKSRSLRRATAQPRA